MRLFYETRIETALEHAPDMQRGAKVAPESNPGAYAVLRDDPDDMAFRLIGADPSAPVPPHVIRVDTYSQVKRLHREFLEVVGYYSRLSERGYFRASNIHERAHHLAAVALGGGGTYNLKVYNVRNASGEVEDVGWVLGFESQSMRTTKIGWAALCVAPPGPSEHAAPSPGDMADIRSMGYEDVQEVGARAVAYNERGIGTPVPVPRMYRPNTRLIIP